ncbi:MAG: hypothetical protein OXN17_17150 [Candidatus Poribacteria bacterium]|nr:hypothetical protein [Candidatus Poribacteria bacterium]MDE0502944.1 hypothetical protein [Candidatus Poribacteria bacterium]
MRSNVSQSRNLISWTHSVSKDRVAQLEFDQPFDLVLGGGIFAHQPTFVASLRSRIKNITPHARVCLPKREPAHGAVLLAMSQFDRNTIALGQ